MYSSLEQFESRIARARRAAIRSKRLVITAGNDLQAHSQWLDKHRAAWSESIDCIRRSVKAQAGIGQGARKALAHSFSRRWHWLAPSFGFLLLLIAADGAREPTTPMPTASDNKSEKQLVVTLSSSITTAPRKIQRSNRASNPAPGFRVLAAPTSDRLSMPPQTIALMMRIARPLPSASEDRTAVTPDMSKTVMPRTSTKSGRLARQTQQLPWLQPLPWARTRQ